MAEGQIHEVKAMQVAGGQIHEVEAEKVAKFIFSFVCTLKANIINNIGRLMRDFWVFNKLYFTHAIQAPFISTNHRNFQCYDLYHGQTKSKNIVCISLCFVLLLYDSLFPYKSLNCLYSSFYQLKYETKCKSVE